MATLGALLANSGDVESTNQMPDYIINAPPEVRHRISALKKLQMQTIDIQAEFFKRVHEIETEFRARYDKINKQRAQIVNGEYEPAENDAGEKIFNWMSDEELKHFEETVVINGGEKLKGIPDFWLNVLRNCPNVSEMLNDEDESVLHFLTDLTVDQTNEPASFTLNFHFAENPFFTNAVLTKWYKLSLGPNGFESKILYDGPSILATKGCEINWKEGKNVTQKVVRKKQKRGDNAGRYITKTVPTDSFFQFFTPATCEVSEDLNEEQTELMNADFEAGQILRDTILDSAVLYYTGELVEDDDFDYGEGEDGEDVDDDGEE